jgi:Ni/Co efflux regulator RcnB
MKKILLSIAAVAALGAAAAPAAAQGWNHGGYSDQRLTTAYVDSLDWKITNAAQEGRISRGEARDLRAQFKAVQTSAWGIQTGQASRGETVRLQAVVNRIEAAVNTPRTYAYGYRR